MIDWGNAQHQVALLILATEGEINQAKSISHLLDDLLNEGWLTHTTRRTRFATTDFGRRQIDKILAARWPAYREDAQNMRTEYGALSVKALTMLRKTAFICSKDLMLPATLNRKTFAAAVLGHSKAIIGDQERARFPEVRLVGDHGVLMRANKGMIIGSSDHHLDCDSVMAMWGVMYLAERRVRADWYFSGVQPQAVVTVENAATFFDMTLPEGWMSLLVEGWNTPVSGKVLAKLPDSVPLIHFGDFDPNGFAIALHLQELVGRPVKHFLPDCALEYVDNHALGFENDMVQWRDAEVNCAHRLVSTLRNQGKWLEQEAITLDPRLVDEIKALIL